MSDDLHSSDIESNVDHLLEKAKPVFATASIAPHFSKVFETQMANYRHMYLKSLKLEHVRASF